MRFRRCTGSEALARTLACGKRAAIWWGARLTGCRGAVRRVRGVWEVGDGRTSVLRVQCLDVWACPPCC